jgi:hypothetical protein
MSAQMGRPPPRTEALLACLLFLSLVWLYQDGLADLPRGDEIGQLRERDFVAPGAPWFWHGVSFTRTRLLSGESRMMFRPVLGAFTSAGLALPPLEWAWWRGLGGIALHFATTLAIVRLLSLRLAYPVAVVLGLTFAVQYSALEMVVWQHIHAYGMAVALFLWGTWLLATERVRAAALLFTVAALTYECTVGALLVLVLVGGFQRRLGWVLAGAIPIGVFLALDVIDLLGHPISPAEDPFAERASDALVVFPGLVADLLGIGSIAWLTPANVQLTVEKVFDRATWNFASSLPAVLYRTLGIGTALLLTGAVCASSVRLARGRADPSDLVVVLVSAYLATIAVTFTWVRTETRGLLGYLGVSTYYFYFTTSCFLVVGALSLAPFLSRFERTRGTVLLAGFALAEIVPSAVLVRQHLAARKPVIWAVSELFREVRSKLPPGGCFAGTLDPLVTRFEPDGAPGVLLGDLSCANQNVAPRPRWVVAREDSRFVLAPLPEPSWIQVPLDGGETFKGGDARSEVLSPEGFAAEAVTVTVDHIGDGGLLAGVTVPTRQVVFGFNEANFWIREETPQAVRYLVESKLLFTAHDAPLTLELHRLDGRWWAFREGMVFGPVDGLADLEGRLGVAHIANVLERQEFSALKVATAPLRIPFERAVPLDLPMLEAMVELEAKTAGPR